MANTGDSAVAPDDVSDLPPDVKAYLVDRGAGKADAVASSIPLWAARFLQNYVSWLFDWSTPVPCLTEDVADLDFPIRVYTPPNDTNPDDPVIVFVHGGGFIYGSIASYDSVCRVMATQSGLRVASVGYRMPPEHRPPTMQLDVCRAIEYVAANITDKFIICGDSAGANLATSYCLQLLMARKGLDSGPITPARAAKLPMPIRQVLIYPSVDFTSKRPSLTRYGTGGWLLSTAGRLYTIGIYLPLPECEALRRDPVYSPLLAPAELLAGMPPTEIITAEHDMLHDDGVAYYDALKAVGVDATHYEALGLFHGFITPGSRTPGRGDVPTAIRGFNEICTRLSAQRTGPQQQ